MGLETVEIVLWAEQEFGIDIPDNEARNILTIGEFVDYLRAKVVARYGSDAPMEPAVFEKLARLLEHRYTIPRERIRPEARFYKDLKLG